jgi:uncharacterized protein
MNERCPSRSLPQVAREILKGNSPMIESHAQGALLHLHVKPKASRNALLGIHGDRLKLAITAAPEKGKANAAVIEFLSHQLDLKRSHVTLVAGETSPLKSVVVRGIEQDDLRKRIDVILAAATKPG